MTKKTLISLFVAFGYAAALVYLNKLGAIAAMVALLSFFPFQLITNAVVSDIDIEVEKELHINKLRVLSLISCVVMVFVQPQFCVLSLMVYVYCRYHIDSIYLQLDREFEEHQREIERVEEDEVVENVPPTFPKELDALNQMAFDYDVMFVTKSLLAEANSIQNSCDAGSLDARQASKHFKGMTYMIIDILEMMKDDKKYAEDREIMQRLFDFASNRA